MAVTLSAGQPAQRRVLAGGSYIVLTIAAILAVVPFAWGFATSLKSTRQIAGAPLAWIPDPLSLDNYSRAAARGLSAGLTNSLLVGLSSVICAVVLGSLAGYALARIRFRYANL